MKRNLFKVVLLLIALYPIISFGFDSSSYIPRMYLEGMMGDELLGQGDIIAPFKLSNDRAFFVYGQGRVSTPEDSNAFDHAPWTGSLGIGGRKIYGNRLLGAYLFGDYSGTSGGFSYFDVSPGIEALGKVWDFRANGYFPIGKKSWSKEDWADKFGVYDYVKYAGHKEFDRWARYDHFQEVAPGGDAEIGRKLFKQRNTLVKAYLGGYYFDMKDNKDILGASARITFQPSQFITFSINDTYDRQYHNTFMLGMRVRLNDLVGGDPEYKVTEDKDLSVRLLDPVERNLGSLANAASIPVSKGKITAEDYGLEHDNIWFFKHGPAIKGHFQPVGDGTYENPYVGFDQNLVNGVKKHKHDGVVDAFPLLYFDEGTYDLGSFTNHRFLLPGGWGMYGRMNNYLEPAQGDHRALFRGGLDLPGNNVLDSIRLENNTEGNGSHGTPQDIGIKITGSNVYMNNISVGALNSTEGYKTGIYIRGATGVTLNGSQVYGYDESEGFAYAKGITLSNNSELILGDDNSISATATGGSGINTFAYGIYAGNGSTVDISGSGNSISATATGGSGDDSCGFAYGIYVINSTLNISGSDNSISATATSGSGINTDGTAYGILVIDSTLNISGSDNSISATATSGSGDNSVGTAYGVFGNNSTVNISGSGNSISAEATGKSGFSTDGEAYGIYAINDSFVNFTAKKTTITVGGSTDTWGIWADSGDTGSHLQIEGTDVTDLNRFVDENWIEFSRTGEIGIGSRIMWGNKDPLPWE